MEIIVGNGNFFDGYIDGWQSIRPDTIPKFPAPDIPPGVPEYRYGYDMGRSAAKNEQMGAQDFEDGDN
jgi:hypothetical protein